jgi:hypothetical protein
MVKVSTCHTSVPEYGGERNAYHDQTSAQPECGSSQCTAHREPRAVRNQGLRKHRVPTRCPLCRSRRYKVQATEKCHSL